MPSPESGKELDSGKAENVLRQKEESRQRARERIWKTVGKKDRVTEANPRILSRSVIKDCRVKRMQLNIA